MHLLLPHRFINTAAVFSRSIGELKQNKSHQLSCQHLMIGKKMEHFASLTIITELVDPRKI